MGNILNISKNCDSNLVLAADDKSKWNELHFEFFKNFSSKHTQKCYIRDIRQFYSFLSEHVRNITSFEEVKRIHLVAYRDYLSESRQAPKTICRKLSALSSYFDYLVEKGIFETNPCSSVKRPGQSPKKPTNDLSDKEVESLLLEVDKSGNLMHRAIIYLLFYTGIRKQELINIRPCDFETREEHVLLNIVGKGQKQVTKVVDPRVFSFVKEYWESLTYSGEKLDIRGPAFMPSKNPCGGSLEKYLNPKSIDYIFKKYCHLAGIFRRVSPHSARASYIGSALENGASLIHVSQDVGHSSVKTTQEYNKRRQSLKDSPVKHLGYNTEKNSA